MSKRKRKAESEPASTTAVDQATSGAPSSSAASDYEQRRQQQIARNQALLSSLTGLTDVSISFSAASAAASAESKRAANAAAKAARDQRKAERAQLLSLLPRRDLPTRSSKTSVNYTEERIVESTSAAAQHHANDEEEDVEDRKNADLSDFVVPDSAALGRISASGSTRSAQYTFTLPLPSLSPYIGLTIPLLYHTPKAAAMSFLFAGWPEESNKLARKPPPTFNKMSGIQKLANHVALFINVDEEAVNSSSRSYDNQWQNGGRQITWFAQPTQRVDTPVIGVIIAAARARKERLEKANADDEYVRSVLGAALQHQNKSSSAAAAATSSASNGKVKKEIKVKQEKEASDEPAVKKSKAASSTAAVVPSINDDAAGDASADPKSLLLFLRFAGGSYLYAGTLAYHSHDTTRTPMKFVFTLAEYDKLVQQEDFLKLLPKNVRGQVSGSSSKSLK